MSDIYTPPVTPPPPPPPPLPPTSRAGAFDFLKPFTYVFDDPRWVSKILVGGLFMLASFLLVGVPFLLGYMARLVRNVVDGAQHPLPEWDDLGEYFSEGLTLFGVGLVYMIPMVILGILVGVPAALMSAVQNEHTRDLGGGLFGCAACLMVPLGLAVTFFMPASFLMVVTQRRFGAAFELANIWSFIRDNIGNYLLSLAIYFVARFLAGFGIILLCIGIIFTEFWSLVVSSYAFAQTWRLAPRR